MSFSGVSNLAYKVFANPLSMLLFVGWLFFTLAEYYGHTHPLDHLERELKYLKVSRGIDLSIPITFIGTLKRHKIVATLISLNLVTFVIRPVFVNLVLLTVYSGYLIIHPSVDFWFHIVVGVSVFLYLCINGAKNKFYVILIAGISLYIYYAKPEIINNVTPPGSQRPKTA